MSDRSAAHPTGTDRPQRTRLWLASVALLLVGVAYALLPSSLRIPGPRLLPFAMLVAALAVLWWLRLRGMHPAARWIRVTATAVASLAIGAAAVALALRHSTDLPSGRQLLGSATLIWALNVLSFALWYWEVDGGGPEARHSGPYRCTDFVFPQFQQDDTALREAWHPELVDYLFLAFSTSTAFSPTDTLILSRRAKLLMMAQSLVSLVIVAVLIARAATGL